MPYVAPPSERSCGRSGKCVGDALCLWSGRDVCRGNRRFAAVRQSAPADGLSRPGAIRAVDWRGTNTHGVEIPCHFSADEPMTWFAMDDNKIVSNWDPGAVPGTRRDPPGGAPNRHHRLANRAQPSASAPGDPRSFWCAFQRMLHDRAVFAAEILEFRGRSATMSRLGSASSTIWPRLAHSLAAR
jgi:hypothetical protein